MIIVSIVGPSMKSALWQMKASKPFADAFEFRLDMIWQPNISLLLSSTRKVTIATCRPGFAGGEFRGREGTRIKILEKAVALGVDYVDLELDANYGKLQKFLQRVKGAKTIVSHHIHSEQFTGFEKLYTRLHGTGADVVKLAFIAWDTTANLHAFELLRRAKSDRRKAVVVAMGEYGQPSRILYKKFGGWATYASSEDGSSAAPGQIPASELHQLFNAQKLNGLTKVFGVIGNPLHQSKGKYIHNEIFRRAKRNMVYCTFPVTDLSKFMRHFAPSLDGFSVTIPYKESIMHFLDELDEAAEAIGAVNTVIRRKGKLYGLNTDAPAALDAIECACKVKGKRLLVLGAGGSARAIAFEAKKRGAEVLVANRTDQRAKKLAKDLDLEHVHMAYIRLTPFDILVNATPVGMVPHVSQSPAPKEILKDKVVFDAVYNPPMTKLLRTAKSVGAMIVPGTEMYVNQAALQSELFTGRRPNIDMMREILLSHLSEEHEKS